MPTVTLVQPTKPGSDRLKVVLDDEVLGVVSAERASELGLAPGRELSPSEIDELRQETDRQEALDRALDYLSYRPRSRTEVERRLRRDDRSEDAVAFALGRCEELGYLDDVELAASHARDRIRLKPRGKMLLAAELRKKGVSEVDAREGIDRAFREEEVTERELARRVAERRWSQVRDDEPERRRRRFRGFLERRGFPFHLIREIADEYLDRAR